LIWKMNVLLCIWQWKLMNVVGGGMIIVLYVWYLRIEDIEGWMKTLVWMVGCDTKGELWGKLELVWFWSDFGWNILKVEVWQNSA